MIFDTMPSDIRRMKIEKTVFDIRNQKKERDDKLMDVIIDWWKTGFDPNFFKK